MRVASNVPRAPPVNFAMKIDASSTVTFSIPSPAVAVRPLEVPSAGRSVMKVFRMPTTSPISPTR
jgi:hypothetical protein